MDFFGSALNAAKGACEFGASSLSTVTSKLADNVPGASVLTDKLGAVTGKTAGTSTSNAATSKQPAKQQEEEKEEEKEPEEKFGDVELKMDYNFEKSSLAVTILQCKELPAMDLGGTSDPYVKVYLLPDKKKKFCTKKLKKTLNPVYNETFLFQKVPFNEMGSKTLVLCVYDYDAVGSDDQIGEVQIPMARIDLGADPEQLQKWYPIKEPPKNVLGDICLSLRYAPTKKPPSLNIIVIECKNLKQMDLGGASDPYVKINHMVGGKRVKKYKTPVKMADLNPYYNQTFKIQVTYLLLNLFQKVNPLEMGKTEFKVYVMDFDKIGSNDAIGQINLSLKDTGTPGKHWRSVLENPKKSIAQWHALEPVEES